MASETLERRCSVCGSRNRKTAFAPLQIVACRSCGFHYRSIGLTGSDYEDLDRYQKATHDPHLMEARSREIRNRAAILTPYLQAGATILDIGANDGALVQALIEAGFQAEGLEPNVQMVDKAQQQGVPVFSGTLEQCPEIDNKQYDAITLFHVIEHLSDPQDALDRIHRLLRPGGLLFLETPGFDSPMFRARRWHANWVAEEHLSYFTKRSLGRLLAQSGFTAERFRRRNWDEEGERLQDILLRLPLLSPLYGLWRRLREPLQPRKLRRLTTNFGAIPERPPQTGLGTIGVTLVNTLERGDGLFVAARKLPRLRPRNSRPLAVKLREPFETLAALVVARLRGAINKPGAGDPNKILIVPTGKLGDLVAQSPIYASLRRNFPSAQLTLLLTNPALAMLVEDQADQIITAQGGLSWRNWLSLRKTLSQQGFGRVYLLAWSSRLDLLAFFSGIADRHGVFSDDIPWAARLTRKQLIQHTTLYRTGDFSSAVYQRLVGGDPDQQQRQVAYKEEWQKSCQEKLAPLGLDITKKTVGILVGCGNKLKLWPPRNWGPVCDFFQEQGFQVCLIGTAGEKPYASEVQKSTQRKLFDSTGALNLKELSGLLKGLHLVLGVDSGPLYLANSLGTPVVDIVGPIEPGEQMPRENASIVSSGAGCSPCSFVMATERQCRFGNRRCLAELGPEQVISAARRALQGAKGTLL